MKRYDIEAECTVEPMNADMYERPNGAYVRWDDLIAAIETLLAREAEALTELRTAMIHSNPELIFKHTMNAIAILYPETPSIRDIAAAHGFDAMPDDIAQRSVDGETNYVRLNSENTHANHD